MLDCGFFFCSTGSRLEEAGKKVGFLYSALYRIEFSNPEGLTAGSSQTLSSFRRWFTPANIKMATHTIFSFKNTVKLRQGEMQTL